MGGRKELKGVEPPEHDTALTIRVRYLVWVESLISIGCHFGPSDLPPMVWDQLLVMNIERGFVDRLVEKRRDKQQKEETDMNRARQATGVPAPGGNLFPQTKPFR